MLGKFTHEVTKLFSTNRYIIIGQSLGGHALLEALQLHTQAISLCLISSPPISLETLNTAFSSDPTDGLLFKNSLNKQEIELFASTFIKNDNKINTELLTQHIQSTQGIFREELGNSLANGQVKNEIDALFKSDIPTIMLRGKYDRFINSDYYQYFTDSKQHPIDIIDFPNSGHSIHLDSPAEFEKSLSNFIYHSFKHNVTPKITKNDYTKKFTIPPNPKKRAAFFDVDDTIISVKSLVSFVQYLNDNKNHEIKLPSISVFLKNIYDGLKNGTSRAELNRYYFSIYKGISKSVVERAAYDWFIEKEKDKGFYIESTINEMQRLKKEGHVIVLVTGSFFPLLSPLTERLNIDDIIHTTPEVIGERYTGELIGTPCIGESKRIKVLEYAIKHNINLQNSWAFGDDDSDLPMLKTVGNGVRIAQSV